MIEKVYRYDLTFIDRAKVKSLESWLENKGHLTVNQKRMLKAIDNKYAPKLCNDMYLLYVIAGGNHVKIGISKDPKRRIRDLQTGFPTTLKLLDQIPVGTSLKLAKVQEKKAHKHCSKYRCTGEWFHADCLDTLKRFTAKCPDSRKKALEYKFKNI